MRRLRKQTGFTIVEVLFGTLIAAVGITSTVGVYGVAGKTSATGARNEIAVNYAQRELERMRTYSYDEVAPKQGTMNQYDGDSRVNCNPAFCLLQVRDGAGQEVMVAPQPNGRVEPSQDFSVRVGDTTVSGVVRRYVTWRDENCSASVQSGDTCINGRQDSKRLTVAVTLKSAGTTGSRGTVGPHKPIWLSTIVTDKHAGPPGYVPGTAAPQAAVQPFHLSSTRCSEAGVTNFPAPSASSTHNTSQTGSGANGAANANLRCRNVVSADRRPDALRTGTPSSNGAPVDMSTELSGSGRAYAGGLLMRKRADDCSTSNWNTYSATSAAQQQQVHTWTTNKFAQDFRIERTVALSLEAGMPDGGTGMGRVCAALFASGPSGSDVLLGRTDISNPCSIEITEPDQSKGMLCGFSLLDPAAIVPADSRLTLVVGVPNSSSSDLVFRYDDAAFESFVQVLTTTPCAGGASPC